MAPEIAEDLRVFNIEGMNARDLSLAELREVAGQADLDFDLVVADLSFISLELVLPAMVATAARTPNRALLLITSNILGPGVADTTKVMPKNSHQV
jgi:23S rRNA (cytidine1920-2'-O)/16S rRNA (cytidine1409-2'-O)-methyltransferase